MADWPVLQNTDRLILSVASPHSLGHAINAFGLSSGLGTYPTANQAFYAPVSVHSPITIVKMFIENGATVSGNVDVGIYDVNGVRLISSGSTAQAGVSAVQEFDITDTLLAPGLYYLAIAMDNTTGTLRRFTPAAAINRAMGVFSQATAFALPAPATFAAVAAASIPIVCATTRTVV